jgi:hypothetical protein
LWTVVLQRSDRNLALPERDLGPVVAGGFEVVAGVTRERALWRWRPEVAHLLTGGCSLAVDALGTPTYTLPLETRQ